MSRRDPDERPHPEESIWHSEELVGLDPDDPEAQAFAAHLDRMQRSRPGFTVEGYLDGVGDFADSANRASGGRRLLAVVLVGLLLLVAGVLIWDALHFVVTTWF
ncbi:MAG: hypothetical protein ACT4O0_07715 [Pseudonocardia sp.]|jgi:hypothetical protein